MNRDRVALVAAVAVLFAGIVAVSTRSGGDDAADGQLAAIDLSADDDAATVGGSPGAAGDGGAGSTPADGTGTGGGTAPGGAAGATGGGTGTQAGTAGGGAVGGSSGTASGGPVRGGRGTTADGKVRIGVPTVNDEAVAAFGQAIGIDGASLGDIREITRVAVEWINANGGYHGFEVEPVFWEGNLADVFTKEGQQREAERACATWQEDNEVFAMLGFGGTSYALLDCAAKHDSPLIDTGRFMLDESLAAKYEPVLYQPDLVTLETRDRMLVEGLVRQGQLKAGRKVALLVNGEQPYFTEVMNDVLVPAIEATGATVVAKAAAPDHFASPWTSYVVSFRQAGADMVVMGGLASVYMSTFFMRAAEDQGWRPDYGMTSDNGIGGLTALAPIEQVKRIHGVGYRPIYDHGFDGIAALDIPVHRQCRAIYDAAGMDYDDPEGNGATMAMYCGNLLFLKSALDAATELTSKGLAAAVEAMGDSYDYVDTWKTTFGPGDHQGPAAVTDLSFDDACECFPIPSGRHGIAD